MLNSEVTSKAYRQYRDAMSSDESAPGFAELGFARLDTARLTRTGDPEVVHGAGKTPDQVAALLRRLHDEHPHRAALATRVDPAALAPVCSALADLPVQPHEDARAVVVGPLPPPAGAVGIVSAGTSDAPVAAEAEVTVRVDGAEVARFGDVGFSGLHRLMVVRDELDRADCLVVVAGMEGALPSVVGLVGTPIVAVPTSIGYGASFGGLAALLAMLNPCAPGVVVSIDNGYGAAVHAAPVVARAAAGGRA